MKTKSLIVCIILLLIASTTGFSQQSSQEINVSPNAPKDKPVATKDSETQKFEEAIKPFVELARKTYPEAKARFVKGLPSGHSFFITTRLYDSARRFEQVFVAVREIKDGKIKGLIWSDIQLVSGYKQGDTYTFPESELIDWTISNPDGTEEGNFVGKFLDTYRPESTVEPAVWRSEPVTPERISQRIEELAIKYQADAPIPRMALYDIGYPLNDQESTSPDGNAVILVTALVQEEEELPLKRVYVLADGKEIDLKSIRQVLSKQSVANSISAKTFGAFRVDMLCLLPLYLRMKSADLILDFAKNKSGFKVVTFGTPVSPEVRKLSVKIPTGVGPSAQVLDEFVKREYPSFFKQ